MSKQFDDISFSRYFCKGARKWAVCICSKDQTITIFTHSAVWKLLRFSLTHFWQKFRESNDFTKELTNEAIWRNIFWWDWIFRFSTQYIAVLLKNQHFFRQIDIFTRVDFTEIFSEIAFYQMDYLCTLEQFTIPIFKICKKVICV